MLRNFKALLLITLTLANPLHAQNMPTIDGLESDLTLPEMNQAVKSDALEVSDSSFASIRKSQDEILVHLAPLTKLLPQYLKQMKAANSTINEKRESSSSEIQAIDQKGVLIQKMLKAISANLNWKENMSKSKGHRECFHHQKVLVGALEMYNMDHGENLTINGSTELKLLKEKRYIKEVPQDPGCGGSDNFRSDGVGNIWCIVHGSVHADQIIEMGELDETAAKGTNQCEKSNKPKPHNKRVISLDGKASE